VIISGSKRDTSISNNLKKEKKIFNKKISKINAGNHKIISKISNLIGLQEIIMLFRQKMLLVIKVVLKQSFNFIKILIKTMIQTYKVLQVAWITMAGALANHMIKQKTIMIATRQNMVKQFIGVGNMKIMKKMKKYLMKVSLIRTSVLIIGQTKIKNLISKIKMLS